MFGVVNPLVITVAVIVRHGPSAVAGEKCAHEVKKPVLDFCSRLIWPQRPPTKWSTAFVCRWPHRCFWSATRNAFCSPPPGRRMTPTPSSSTTTSHWRSARRSRAVWSGSVRSFRASTSVQWPHSNASKRWTLCTWTLDWRFPGNPASSRSRPEDFFRSVSC